MSMLSIFISACIFRFFPPVCSQENLRRLVLRSLSLAYPTASLSSQSFAPPPDSGRISLAAPIALDACVSATSTVGELEACERCAGSPDAALEACLFRNARSDWRPASAATYTYS